jgi:hypothetical protein
MCHGIGFEMVQEPLFVQRPPVEMVVADLCFKTTIHTVRQGMPGDSSLDLFAAWNGDNCELEGMHLVVARLSSESVMNAACARTLVLLLADTAILSLLCDIPPPSYRIGTVPVTPHVVHHAAKTRAHAGRASHQPPEGGLCAWTSPSRVRGTSLRNLFSPLHHARRFAQSGIRLKSRSITRTSRSANFVPVSTEGVCKPGQGEEM